MKKTREGLTLVEVVVALVMIAILMTSLSGLMYATARQAVRADNATSRQAIALQTVNRFATMPYANIAGAAGCTNIGPANRQFQSCITLTAGVRSTIVDIVTTPLQNNVPASSMRIIRAAPVVANPLCTGCP